MLLYPCSYFTVALAHCYLAKNVLGRSYEEENELFLQPLLQDGHVRQASDPEPKF